MNATRIQAADGVGIDGVIAKIMVEDPSTGPPVVHGDPTTSVEQGIATCNLAQQALSHDRAPPRGWARNFLSVGN